ncbi:GNAT family N-acetyltransferase [Nocardia higoensis]|uniref:GNAT family N-acetyltransferase n=1 Tax=Nocardia higoensis TaxID=228599 RepID=A0ABS0DKZ0_9NOCA|nr:GNAT family N-acetyltransferase [Nocardia higoensis]MBF6357373.1 GNAT family N-acetyltransferase [Nocardia higoensis]
MTTDPAPSPAIAPGRRVVLRYRLPAGSSPPLTDVIGEVVTLDPLTVRDSAGGTVTVTADQIVAVRVVGPRPVRTGEIRALEAAAADAWPGLECEMIDGWLARAGHGYTDRANSAVPLGLPGQPARLGRDVLHRLSEWFAARELPPRLVLPDRLAPAPPGWHTWGETLVLGLDIDNFVLPQGPSMVRTAPEPDEAWLQMHALRGEAPSEQPVAPPDRDVLTAVREGTLGFASLGLPRPIAIARGALTTAPDGRRWVGLTCVSVAAEHRRHGLAVLVNAELIRWGRDRGATHAYVQVAANNAGALALYRDLGFVDHHYYRYAAPAS